MTVRKIALIAAALLCVSAVAGLYGFIWVFQKYAIVSFPHQGPVDPSKVASDARVLNFRSGDGTIVWARLAMPAPGKPLIISFYGSDAELDASFKRLNGLRALGYGLAMMEYRSSGATTGTASEENFVADGLAFYDQLDQLAGTTFPASMRVLHGFSLGAGVGSQIAAERPFAAVVLEASPYRMCDHYEEHNRFVPFCALMWSQRYDVIDHVLKIKAPTLIVHGSDDQTLPVAMARKMYEEMSQPKRYVEIPGGRHADLHNLGLISAMDSFISEYVVP